MLHPALVVAIGEVLVGMGPAAFCAVMGAGHGDHGLNHQVFELQGFNQVGVPDHATVADLEVCPLGLNGLHTLDAVGEAFRGPEHGGVFLHDLLHFQPKVCSCGAAIGIAQLVEPGQVAVGHGGLKLGLGCPGLDGVGGAQGR